MPGGWTASGSIVINDCKDGEVAIQAAETCARFGRNVATLDETAITGEDNSFRVDLSPYSSVRDAFEKENGELVFAIDTANHALIPEPPNDGKNQYFRDEPRTLLEFCKNELLSGDPRMLTPDMVWSMLANPDVLLSAARLAVEDGDEVRKALGAHVLDMHENKEHWGQCL